MTTHELVVITLVIDSSSLELSTIDEISYVNTYIGRTG